MTVSTKINIVIQNGVQTTEKIVKLGTKTFASFDLDGTHYKLDRANAARLLTVLEAYGENCSEGCKQVRNMLAAALS